MSPALKLFEPARAPAPRRTWSAGEVVFFWGKGLISGTIELMTRGPSHVAIVGGRRRSLNGCFVAGADGQPLLFESTTLCDIPDALTGRTISGVQAHHIDERIDAYDGRVAVMRPEWPLDQYETLRLEELLAKHHGRPYDTVGALLSGTRLFKWTRLMPYPSLGHEFCSELVAAALERAHKLPVSDAGTYNPASLMRALLRFGTYLEPEVIRDV